jgi:hypothetical protein
MEERVAATSQHLSGHSELLPLLKVVPDPIVDSPAQKRAFVKVEAVEAGAMEKSSV